MRDFKLTLAEDGIEPGRVPVRTLRTGARMPAVGMGTCGSGRYDGETVAAAVIEAATLGYRHFDCASVYGNEPQIGQALELVRRGGVAREELWVTSKLWNDMHGKGEVTRACLDSLSELRLNYLDLYVVHWPFPNFHPKGCGADYHNANAKPYAHEAFMRVWEQMEELVRRGLVRAIGTSNMSEAKMRRLLRDCSIKPAVNEMELHPHFQQPGLYDYLVANDVQPVGFCSAGSPSRPARDRAPEDSCDTADPVVAGIARRLGVHPAEVCVMWAVARGAAAVPFAVKRVQLLGNLRAAAEGALTPEDLRALAGVDRGCRLVRGQEFVWREGLTWEALWDGDGTIAR